MSLRVTLHPDAEIELREAARWYEHRHSGLGLRLLEAVDEALAHIARWPDAAALVPNLPANLVVRQAAPAHRPVHVAFIVEHDTLHVLTTAHDPLSTRLLA